MWLMRASIPASYITRIINHLRSRRGKRGADLDAGIRSSFHRREKIVIRRVERNSKGTIDDPAIDMHPEVDFHHILILQNDFSPAWTWGGMGSCVV
jgi:hypothetical protein